MYFFALKKSLHIVNYFAVALLASLSYTSPKMAQETVDGVAGWDITAYITTDTGNETTDHAPEKHIPRWVV